jgi:hypothetical protein
MQANQAAHGAGANPKLYVSEKRCDRKALATLSPQNATLEPGERIGVEGVLKYLDHTWRLTDAPQGAQAKRTPC